jgi:excisionase family DNA binding protein
MTTNETIGLNTSEAARECRVSTATLLKWVKEGRIPYISPGGRKLIFSRKEIEAFLSGKTNQPPAPPTGTATSS